MARFTDLQRLGQSIWLDYIDRALLTGGGLEALVEEGLRGVTSNPSIFHKAISGGEDYDEGIRELIGADPAVAPETLLEWLTVEDVQLAADILRPVFDESAGEDGYVSLEVSPHLAHDADATVAAARHLWRAVRRDNLMIKVPGTREGLTAIEELTAEGINVNVTLLFSVERYVEAANAWLRGLARNPEPRGIASVASFFVSRIDTKVDAALEAAGTGQALELRGRIAIANAKRAYQRFKTLLDGEAYAAQRARGARPQRLLWGSTSAKNPSYPDLLYVESLIGLHTVNTVPPETLDALRDHGRVAATLETDVDRAERDLEGLAALGIDLEAITGELEREGVEAFAKAHDALLEVLASKARALARRAAGG